MRIAAKDLDHKDHVVQFYETDAYLVRVVVMFLAAGLRHGAPALVICTFEHRAAIAAALDASGLRVKQLQNTGALNWLDARVLLQQVSVNHAGAAEKIREEIEPLVLRLNQRSGDEPLRIFGELVDLLWAEGRKNAAIAIEEMWGRVVRAHHCNLLCAYRVNPARSNAAGVRAICARHSHVLRPEKSIGIEVLDDERGHPERLGEREMVRAQRLRDQRVADALREDLAHNLVSMLAQLQLIKAQLPPMQQPNIDESMRSLSRALNLSLLIANQVGPFVLRASSLGSATEKYAAMTERLFGVVCKVSVSKSFVDPDRMQRELLYAIAREVVDRAAREGGAKQIAIKLSQRKGLQRMAVYHDGERVVSIGASDDEFRRLVYQARALGCKCVPYSTRKGDLQLMCRW